MLSIVHRAHHIKRDMFDVLRHMAGGQIVLEQLNAHQDRQNGPSRDEVVGKVPTGVLAMPARIDHQPMLARGRGAFLKPIVTVQMAVQKNVVPPRPVHRRPVDGLELVALDFHRVPPSTRALFGFHVCNDFRRLLWHGAFQPFLDEVLAVRASRVKRSPCFRRRKNNKLTGQGRWVPACHFKRSDAVRRGTDLIHRTVAPRLFQNPRHGVQPVLFVRVPHGEIAFGLATATHVLRDGRKIKQQVQVGEQLRIEGTVGAAVNDRGPFLFAGQQRRQRNGVEFHTVPHGQHEVLEDGRLVG